VVSVPGLDVALNSDGVLHNVHTHSHANPTVGQAPQFQKATTATLSHPGMVKITCDAHS
jgi:hypothetical protein